MHKYLNTTHHSVTWFNKVFQGGDLVIKPPFQRNPVWSLRQKGSLIETILMEYPIPEIYMQELTDSTGKQSHILVDGQQRIRAVLGFLVGDFELDEENTSWPGFAFEDLSADDKKKIYEYQFVVRVLPELPDEELRNIFLRLNRNTTTLNAQELRHATYWGPFIRLMEEIADFEFWSEAGIFSANDRRRMIDVEFVSELAVAVLNGLQNKKKLLEEFYQQYETKFEDAESLRSLFVTVLGELAQILPDISKVRWKKKSDFYSLFVTFAQFASMLPLDASSRIAARESLTAFGSAVDTAIKFDNAEEPSLRQLVDHYVRYVERAASDLGSRRERERVLKTILAAPLRIPPAEQMAFEFKEPAERVVDREVNDNDIPF